ncbi:MAG TPA: GIY-YIG nuclease family protein [Aquella sp.]|nr:GIY-YIG nuclease family protein [Aquella sp.]
MAIVISKYRKPRNCPNRGIYLIRSLCNNRYYIGSSNTIAQRRGTHLTALRANTHKNIHLQRIYNKYGEDNLIFEIILYCEKDFGIEMEGKLIRFCKQQDKNNCINISLDPVNHTVSEETRKKMSDAQKGKKRSPEAIERIRQTQLNRPRIQ